MIPSRYLSWAMPATILVLLVLASLSLMIGDMALSPVRLWQGLLRQEGWRRSWSGRSACRA